jgi:Flp pilus assembly protein TadB
MTALVMAAGFGIGVGLVLLGYAVLVAPRSPASPVAGSPRRTTRRISPTHAHRLGVGITVGLLGLLVTGWPVALLVGPLAALGLPALLAPPPHAAQIPRLEALQEWTRGLAGVLTVGIGLEQAIIATARSAPAAIRPQVSALAGRLAARTPTDVALRAFADELADPTGDLIVTALLLGASRRGQGMAGVLENLAASVADEVRIRRAVEADQSKVRTAAKLITAVTMLMMGGLFIAGTYTRPYGSPLGQVVLILLIAGYAGALAWMRRIANGTPPVRLIDPTGAPA